jgi:hypothetical protein
MVRSDASANASRMPVTLAHLVGLFICIVALAREYPESMSTLGEWFVVWWAYRRFLR